MNLLDYPRQSVRSVMNDVAAVLNRLSGGRLSPNVITVLSLVAHPFIALAIAGGNFVLAACLLIFFGLFDSLDGALARYQKAANPRGMFLDASSDRLKEAMLYVGAAAYFAGSEHPRYAVWCVAACGVALSISYVKAKGEAALSSIKKVKHDELNRLFSDGVMSLEVRMFVLVIGLFANQLLWAVVAVSVIGGWTVIVRFVKIYRYLGRVQA